MLKNIQKKVIIFNNSPIDQILYLIIIGFILVCPSLVAQSDQALKVSIEVKDMKVSALLNELQQQYNLNLSYNAGDSAFDKIVSYRAVQKPVNEVLLEVLKLSGHQFKIIENQFVIFPLKDISTPQTTNNTAISSAIKPALQTHDTVFVDKLVFKTDTLIKIKTVIQYDTVIQHDTITIFKEPVPEKVKGKIKKVRTDVFNNDARREIGWAFGVSYGKQYTDFKISALGANEEIAAVIDKSENWSFRGNLLSFSAIYNYHKLKASASVAYNDIITRFDFKKVTTSGGLFNVDTLDAYYTLNGSDTNWVYIKDSTWIPVNRMEYNYNQINRLSYLDFQLNAAYTVFQKRNVSIYLHTGFTLNFLLSAKGSTVSKTSDYQVVDFKDLKFNKINHSYVFGAGVRIKLNDDFDVNPEIYYMSRTRDLYQSHEISKKVHGVGLKVGLLYYL